MPTKRDYEDTFYAEAQVRYPVIEEFERRMGFNVGRTQLESAARRLACPVKINPPNWQHGYVIYSSLRRYLSSASSRADGVTPAGGFATSLPPAGVLCLDVGTAKGFSALCMSWALIDSCVDRYSRIVSVDVIDPAKRVRRNTVSEVDGLLTLEETLKPWYHDLWRTEFVHSSGEQWIARQKGRIHFAFVDGKHTFEAVSAEASLLAGRQLTGDIVIFDDLQVPGVERAVCEVAEKHYKVERLEVLKNRVYGYAVRL